MADTVMLLLIAGCLWAAPGTISKAWRYWFAALMTTLAMHVAVGYDAFSHPMMQVAGCFLWMIPQTLLFLAIVSASSWAGSLALGIPLLVGTLGAWLAQAVGWSGLEALRTGSKMQEIINTEYFAQISQLLPLLLIALAVEFRSFRQQPNDLAAVRARTVVVVAILVLGELLALSMLPYPEDAVLAREDLWITYAAFTSSIDAVFVAFATLVYALFAARRDDGSRHSWADVNGRRLAQTARRFPPRTTSAAGNDPTRRTGIGKDLPPEG